MEASGLPRLLWGYILIREAWFGSECERGDQLYIAVTQLHTHYARLLAVERSQIDPSSIIRSSLVLPILETLEALEQAMESVVLPLLVPSEEKQGQQ